MEHEQSNRSELRGAYSWVCISVLLYLLLMEALATALPPILATVAPGLSTDFAALMTLNDLVAYLPGVTLLPLMLRRLPSRRPARPRNLSPTVLGGAFVLSMGLGIVCSLVSSFFIQWLAGSLGQEAVNAVSELEQVMPLSVTAVSFVLVAPVCEEFIFRRVLLQKLRFFGDATAIIFSSAAFALFHLNLYQTLYAFVIGCVFAAIVLYTGRLRYSIVLHMIINGISVVITAFTAPWVSFAYTLLLIGCVGGSIALIGEYRGRFHTESGPLPYSAEEKRHAALRSPWLWICLTVGLGLALTTLYL